MLITKLKPVTVGEMFITEFMQPMGLTQAALAAAMGVQPKHVNAVQQPAQRDGNDRTHDSRRDPRAPLAAPPR